MAGGKYFKQLGRTCIQIADEVAGVDGFIAIRDLVKRFRIEIVSRPLLVEAMLASTQTSDETEGKHQHQWCLLLDRETHEYSEPAIQNERGESPLPVRLRNTIAHELAHSLAFRTRDFGVEIPRLFKKSDAKTFIIELERETEALSPLLLISNKSLDQLFSPTIENVSLAEIIGVMRKVGSSRESFVNRLQLVEKFDNLRIQSRDSFNNLAIGIGEWVSSDSAVLRPWPLFTRFTGGYVPGFIFDLQRRTPVDPARIFHKPFSFLSELVSILSETVSGGTPTRPTLRPLNVRFSTESVSRTKGSDFLFLVQVFE